MNHLPVIPEVIVLDFLPEPEELQGLIQAHLPGLATAPSPSRLSKAGATHRLAPVGRVEAFILLDFLPSLVSLDGVIRGHRAKLASQTRGSEHY